MQMHSRASLYQVHGIGVAPRRRRSRPIAGRLIARMAALLAIAKRAIINELALRRAVAELDGLDDRMLRDLGISRCDIAGVVRRHRSLADLRDPAA